jgi:D-galactarolactone isomerase
MTETRWSRRSILKTFPGLALGAVGVARGDEQQSVRGLAGTGLPKTKVPAHAADCHFHIYDGRFPADAKAVLHPPDATVADYRLLQKRLGTTRCVLVQPSTYGLDNRLLLEALGQFGASSARGVAVANPGIPDAELKRMHAAGVRGFRFNLVQAGATTLEMVDPLSKRAASLGWHIQVHATADQIEAAKEVWNRSSCPIVFDHLGKLPAPQGIRHPAFGVICGLLQKGKAWVKLSGLYYESKIGPPSYADSVEVAKAYVKEAPERLVWGRDWPHPTITDSDKKPDDAALLDLLAVSVPEATLRNRVLVDNAAKLYGFE